MVGLVRTRRPTHPARACCHGHTRRFGVRSSWCGPPRFSCGTWATGGGPLVTSVLLHSPRHPAPKVAQPPPASAGAERRQVGRSTRAASSRESARLPARSGTLVARGAERASDRSGNLCTWSEYSPRTNRFRSMCRWWASLGVFSAGSQVSGVGFVTPAARRGGTPRFGLQAAYSTALAEVMSSGSSQWNGDCVGCGRW